MSAVGIPVLQGGEDVNKLKDACMAALAMLLIILFPNMEDL